MIKGIVGFLIDQWDKYFPCEEKPKKISFLQLCGDSDYRITEKIEFFLFFDGRRYPTLVISLPRNPKYTELLQNEYLSLKKLYSINSEFLKNSVPKPILYEKIGITNALITGYCAGRTMEHMIIKKRVSQKMSKVFLKKMTEWLLELNFHTVSEPIGIYEYANNLLKEYISYYPIHKSLFVELLDSVKGISMPSTFIHGNPAAGNILVENPPRSPLLKGGVGGLRLVDWALAREKGLPLSDLLIFLTWYGMTFFNTGDFQKDYRLMFFESNHFSNNVKEIVHYYCERVNIDKKLIMSLFFLTWVEYAIRKFRFMAINKDYHISLFTLNGEIDPNNIKKIWNSYLYPNQSLHLLYLADKNPVNIQMLFEERDKFILG